MDSELTIKGLGQFRMTDNVTTAESVQTVVAELSATDSRMTTRIGTVEGNLDTVSFAAASGRQFLGIVNDPTDVQNPVNGDMVAVKSTTDSSYVRTYIYCVPTGEEEGEWYMFGDDQKVYGVSALPSISTFSTLNIGRVYLLTDLQAGYTKGHFYRVAQNAQTLALYWEDFSTVQNIPLGNVQNIKFSFTFGNLAVYWDDPDDVTIDGAIVSKWAKTILVVKQGSYPTSPSDGTAVITSLSRNQYSTSPAKVQLDPDIVWYCRFFPCNESGVYSQDTAGNANRFKTDIYTWTDVQKYLEDYDRYSAVLPSPGDAIYLDYVISDYWIEDGTATPASTRAVFMDNLDKLSSVAMPWRVLGYNSNVPQYVKYRRKKVGTHLGETTTSPTSGVITINGTVVTDYSKNDTCDYKDDVTGQIFRWIYTGTQWLRDSQFAEYDYLWVSSVDDTLSVFDVYKSGIMSASISCLMGSDESYGPGWLRDISADARTYTMSYDTTTGIKSYVDSGYTVVSASTETLGYRNGGVNNSSPYLVPRYLKMSDDTIYSFCGYTMTVQPQNCLNGVSLNGTTPTHYNNIQFDASESQYGLAYNTYDNFNYEQSDYGYYWRDGQNLNSIDVWGEQLSGLPTQKYNGHDVYKAMPGGKLKKQTTYYELNVSYVRKDGTTYTRLTNCFEYADFTAYSVGQYVATFASSSDTEPNAIYKVLSAVPATNETPPAENSSFELDATGILTNRTYAVYGRVIPTDINVYMTWPGTDTNRRYGCNIYSESNYRQYINNLNGYADANYTKQNPMDVVSTTGLMRINSPMLKLSKNADFVSMIVPAVNINVLATAANQQYYRKFKMLAGNYVEHTIDMFWPLSNQETFGTDSSGIVWFNEVLGTNAKRIKYYLKSNGSKDSAAFWWLRYPDTGNTNTEYGVSTSGSSTYDSSLYSYGCAPACLIG